MLRGYFVTGTDTGVGKTLVSEILIRHLRLKHSRVAGFKPVASGADWSADGLRNTDALTLWQASSIDLPYEAVNPYVFVPPVAPHLAAADAGVDVDLDLIKSRIEQIPADRVVVEGVGGWRVPLNARECVADLAERLGLPVVLVVGLRLGCLNHALLTAEAIANRGLALAGWVANRTVADFPRDADNVRALGERLPAPLLLDLPHFTDPAVAARQVIRTLPDRLFP